HVLCQSNYQVRIQTSATDYQAVRLLHLVKFTQKQKDKLILAGGLQESCDIGMKIAFSRNIQAFA
ncbi:hypothetical protein N8Z70_03225, partial [Candidatus Puniceispirillum sp.]|nr:hypothetical protein [Candidatus Puniceispirillum sp.]